jgi:hypothetical protein
LSSGASIAKSVDVAGGGNEPVPVSGGVGYYRDGGTGTATDSGTRTFELGITKGKDASVGRHHKVALAVSRGNDPDDWGVETV